MAAPLPKRIIKETERLQNEPVPGISAQPHDENARYFDVTVDGPGGSCYEGMHDTEIALAWRHLRLTSFTGGVFKLELFLPDDYPMCPPRIRFLTRIYHPNIDRLGRICLDVLKNNWSPALQIRTILLSIQALLGAPNPEDPLNEAVAKQWKVCDQAARLTWWCFEADSTTGGPACGHQDRPGMDAAIRPTEVRLIAPMPCTKPTNAYTDGIDALSAFGR